MNASVTMGQAGQSEKMVEARLLFEEHKTILKWYLNFQNVEFLPRSSDLITCDFYQWGTLKGVLCCRKPATLVAVQERTETACAVTQVGTLVNVAQAVVRPNQKCLDADGNHSEHLL